MNKNMLNRLRNIFKESGMTQTEIAKKTNVTSAYIWKILNNENVSPRILFLEAVCKEFNINYEWLETGTGEKFLKKSTFSLDDYANANKLSETERTIVCGFMELKPEIRNAVYDIFKKAFETNSSAYNNAPDNPQELERMYPPVNDNNKNSNIG